MHIEIPRLSELVTLFTGGAGQQERLEADRRTARYYTAFGLQRDAACLFDQLAQVEGSLPITHDQARRAIGRRGQVIAMRTRSPDLCMAEIRAKVGADAVETVEEGWRLSPLGRIRSRRALGESFVL